MTMDKRIEAIKDAVAPMRTQLANHAMYERLTDKESVRLFMEHHVFAVWDFMSLTKWLQYNLVSNGLPWIPPVNSKIARFVNEIVLAEESDVDMNGSHKSHFEMYMSAMKEIGADTHVIDTFLTLIRSGNSVTSACETLGIPKSIERFMAFTFTCLQSNKAHVVASAFTFGREDVIPEMFLGILEKNDLGNASELKYYMQRHIELDGDEHGPMAMEMVRMLCGSDKEKWKEAELAAITALNLRIRLWDGVENKLLAQKLAV